MSLKVRTKITHGLGETMWTLKGPDLEIDASEPSMEAALKRQNQAVKASVLSDYGADFEVIEAKSVIVTTYSIEKRRNTKLSSFGAGAREEEQRQKDLLEAERLAQEAELKRRADEEAAAEVAAAQAEIEEGKEKPLRTRRGRGKEK